MSLRKYGITEEVQQGKIALGLRWCSKHKDFLGAGEFSGTGSYCRSCANQYNADRTDTRWHSHLRITYGVTPEWYAARLAEQRGLCAICEKPESNGRRL